MPRYDDDIDDDERSSRRRDRNGYELPTEEEQQAEEKDRAEGEAVAKKKCFWPGLLMVIAGAGGIVGNVLYAVLNAPTPGGGPGGAATVVMFTIQWGIALTVGVVLSAIQVAGGVFLMRRKSRGMVITGAMLGCLPCTFAAPLGWVAAVWMFMAMQDPDVTDVFDRAKR